MIFWDSSALVQLLVKQKHSVHLQRLASKDPDIVVWWGAYTECCSALARLRRESFISEAEEDTVRGVLDVMSEAWIEISPSEEVKKMSGRCLLRHPLAAADALQLAAALVWARKAPEGLMLACLDDRLRVAARKEGFRLTPAVV